MLGCAGLSLRSYWSPDLGSWSKLEPKMFLYSSKSSPLFSVFGKTAVSFLLMRRDAFTHLYTIKCWMCSCIPSRNLGFLPFLAQGQPCRFTALQQEHTRRSWCSCLDIKHHWKNHHWKQKKNSSGISSLNPPDAVGSLLSGEKMNLCPWEGTWPSFPHVPAL